MMVQPKKQYNGDALDDYSMSVAIGNLYKVAVNVGVALCDAITI
jgi:hypothetical protein